MSQTDKNPDSDPESGKMLSNLERFGTGDAAEARVVIRSACYKPSEKYVFSQRELFRFGLQRELSTPHTEASIEAIMTPIRATKAQESAGMISEQTQPPVATEQIQC